MILFMASRFSPVCSWDCQARGDLLACLVGLHTFANRRARRDLGRRRRHLAIALALHGSMAVRVGRGRLWRGRVPVPVSALGDHGFGG